MKLRPVLLLTSPVGPVPEVLVAYISSVVPTAPLPTDFVIGPGHASFPTSGLRVDSAIRLHKLATIHRSSLLRRLGLLDTASGAVVAAKLRTFLQI